MSHRELSSRRLVLLFGTPHPDWDHDWKTKYFHFEGRGTVRWGKEDEFTWTLEHREDATVPVGRLHFAYGSNMDPQQMAERCPGTEPVGAAALRDHRFEIGERGVATVGAFPDSTTWGVLWWISAAHEEALDRREGVRVGLYRREVLGVDAPWGTSASLVYVEPFNGSSAPRGGYMESILRGAKAFGLPDEYVADLASRYA